MRTRGRPMIELYGQAFLVGAIGTACTGDAKPAFPVMAPIEPYREARGGWPSLSKLLKPGNPQFPGFLQFSFPFDWRVKLFRGVVDFFRATSSTLSNRSGSQL